MPISVRIGRMGLERAVKIVSVFRKKKIVNVLGKCEEGRKESGRIGECLRIFMTFSF